MISIVRSPYHFRGITRPKTRKNFTMGGRTTKTILIKRSDWYKRLLLTTAVAGVMMIGMPPFIAAENLQEKSQEQEAMAVINHAISTWQNFMNDPDMSGFRAHVKGGQGVLIFPRLMKGAFVLGAEGGNGVLLVRHDRK